MATVTSADIEPARDDRAPLPAPGDKSPVWRDGGRRAVLVLHGFTGTPFEVRPLVEALHRSGYTAYAPLLAGHGETADRLAATGWPDWLASAETALDRLLARSGGAPVGVVGFSAGGLLALRLALRRPRDIAALAILAAPLRLRPRQVLAIRALSHLPRFLRRGPLWNIPKRRGYDVVDEAMKRRNPGLRVLPMPGLASLVELGALIRADLPHVKVPTLVAHGERDRTVPLEDSLELVGSIGAPITQRLWLPRSGHLLGIDVEHTILADAIGRFFSTQLPAPQEVTP